MKKLMAIIISLIMIITSVVGVYAAEEIVVGEEEQVQIEESVGEDIVEEEAVEEEEVEEAVGKEQLIDEELYSEDAPVIDEQEEILVSGEDEWVESFDPDDEEMVGDDDTNKTVSILFPTQDLQRWEQDGKRLAQALREAGYEVYLQFAFNDVAMQASQMEEEIQKQPDILIVAPIEGDSLGVPLDLAKERNIPVIAYDRLLMNSDAVSYYVTFNDFKVGELQGEYIKDKLDLQNTDGPFNLEVFAGPSDEVGAQKFYEGAMSVLMPYIEQGKLVVRSGQIQLSDTAINAWYTYDAQIRMESILSALYSNGTNLDAVLCPNDSIALGVTNALVSNYTGTYPIVTGQDCDIENVNNIIRNRQAMSVFKKTSILVDKAVEMVVAVLEETDVPFNNEDINNNVITVKTFLCDPIVVTINNYYDELVESGYYTESQLNVHGTYASPHEIETIPGEAATCTEDGKTDSTRCKICRQIISPSTLIPRLGHDWTSWKITISPTTTTEGEIRRECLRCGEIETNILDKTQTPTLEKLANPMKVKVTNPTTVKTSKKKQTIKAAQVFTISNAQGKVTFSKKSGAAALSIKPNGNIVVAKNTKKGTYKMKVAVNAAGNSKYTSVTKTVTVKVKVKK